MRNKLGLLAAGLSCLILLAGCGKTSTQEEGAAYTKEQVQLVLDSGVFTDELDELDCDIAWSLYGFEDAGLVRENLVDGVIYRSAGATCEEIACLQFDQEESAATAKTAIDTYLTQQVEENRDYRPQELPKLEEAFVGQSGDSVLLVVSPDTQQVEQLLQSK